MILFPAHITELCWVGLVKFYLSLLYLVDFNISFSVGAMMLGFVDSIVGYGLGTRLYLY